MDPVCRTLLHVTCTADYKQVTYIYWSNLITGLGTTSLTDYVSRMKDKQDAIYYIAGASREEVEKSPFVERLLKKGFEVLYLTEAVDEYCIGALPEFENKKFQNVAKEGLTLADGKAKEKLEETKTVYEPLTKWLTENALKEQVSCFWC